MTIRKWIEDADTQGLNFERTLRHRFWSRSAKQQPTRTHNQEAFSPHVWEFLAAEHPTKTEFEPEWSDFTVRSPDSTRITSPCTAGGNSFTQRPWAISQMLRYWPGALAICSVPIAQLSQRVFLCFPNLKYAMEETWESSPAACSESDRRKKCRVSS